MKEVEHPTSFNLVKKMSVSQSLSDGCKHEIDEQKAKKPIKYFSILHTMESLYDTFKQQLGKIQQKSQHEWFRDLVFNEIELIKYLVLLFRVVALVCCFSSPRSPFFVVIFSCMYL